MGKSDLLKDGMKSGLDGLLSSTKKSPQKKETKDGEVWRLIVSVVLLVLLMYVGMGHMVGLPLPAFFEGTENAVSFAFVQFLLTLPRAEE